MKSSRLFRRILVPHDFSPPASRALRVAADLAAAHRGRLVVLGVLEPFYPPAEMPAWVPSPETVRSERERLSEIVGRVLKGRRVPVECRVEVGQPAARILGAAKRADVIVIATAGRSGLGRVLLGSVAEKVVRHSPVPVLTVRR